jgi:allantoicase
MCKQIFDGMDRAMIDGWESSREKQRGMLWIKVNYVAIMQKLGMGG